MQEILSRYVVMYGVLARYYRWSSNNAIPDDTSLALFQLSKNLLLELKKSRNETKCRLFSSALC